MKHVTSLSLLSLHNARGTMAPDRVEKTAYFQGKSLEFVADWLEKNILSKFKSVFKGTFVINCSTKVHLMRTRMDGVHHKHRNISSVYLYETDARLYIKHKSQSSVLVKQAKKNSFKMLSSICSPDFFCACAIFRIKHASRMPVRLDFFLQLFSFSM